MTWPEGPPARRRFELRRVDEERRVYRFVHDLRTYSEACLYADVAVRMLGGDFVVFDAVESAYCTTRAACATSSALHP